MNRNLKRGVFFASGFLLATPFLAAAQQLQPVRTLIGSLGFIINAIIPLMMAAAVAAFFYGLVKKLITGKHGVKDGGPGKSRDYMIGGLVALFIMASLWGIIKVVQSAFDIQPGGTIQPPTVPILN